MRLPLSWLNDFVKVDDIDPHELAEKLTRAGLQVESIETIGGAELSELIVVAEVLECEAHPDSDHLHICKVTDGKTVYQVVCGAPNMRKGIKTAFAKIGALIPEGDFKIKKGKLRGVESFGMCCSEKELHIGAGEAGIIEYPIETPNGTLVRDVANLPKPEIVFDIEVTWNRPDALSVLGLAREFGAILHRPLTLPDVSFVESATDVNDEVKVVVEDTVKCPRYTARVITSVENVPSPELMVNRLKLCGISSHSLAIDVTNYVLMELGQPQHAFDYRTLKDRTVVVRCAKAGEKMKTLDGVERELDTSMLMICDAEKPNCVAGIMGGEESGVAESTMSVLLESALFEPVSTKNTATKLNLASESAYRYIRGVDKDLADFASRRTCHLLQKYGKAVIAKGVIDVDNRVVYGKGKFGFNKPVTLNFERARKLIGINIGNDAMVYQLNLIGLNTIKKQDHFAAVESVQFEIPSWRWDLTMEADLVEEIARLYGLDNIPDTMPSAPSISALSDAPFRAKCKVREFCMGLGFSEAMHYSFLSAKELDDFDSRSEVKSIRLVIPDPVSAEYGVMRDSLLPQMYESLGRNAAHQLESAALFEIGKVFHSQKTESGMQPSETEMLSFGFFGPIGREELRKRIAISEEETVLWLKGMVEELIAKLHAGHVEFAPTERPAFTVALEVRLNGKSIGVIGALNAKLKHAYRLTTQMGLGELELKMLIKKTTDTGKVSAVPQYPSVMRDISFVPKDGVANDDIVKLIRKTAGKILTKIKLFDIFKGSRAYSLEFRSNERTLTDDEVGVVFQKVVDAVKEISK